jgi:hypothetical protein
VLSSIEWTFVWGFGIPVWECFDHSEQLGFFFLRRRGIAVGVIQWTFLDELELS